MTRIGAILTEPQSLPPDPRVPPFIIMSSEPTGTGSRSELRGRTFDIATDYGWEREASWYLSCNCDASRRGETLVGPGTRGLIFRWNGHGMPVLGGLMKVTRYPYQQWEPKKKRRVWYVDGEIRSLYPNARPDAPPSPLFVPGEVIAADPSWAGHRPLKKGPKRFRGGEQVYLQYVQTCISYLPPKVQNWFHGAF